MSCSRWKESEAIEWSDQIGNSGFYIVDRTTGWYEEIYNCPFCGSLLDENGCTKEVNNEKLVEEITDTINDYILPYDDSLEFLYETKEKLEDCYDKVRETDWVGKDLICDHITDYITAVGIDIKNMTLGGEGR